MTVSRVRVRNTQEASPTHCSGEHNPVIFAQVSDKEAGIAPERHEDERYGTFRPEDRYQCGASIAVAPHWRRRMSSSRHCSYRNGAGLSISALR